MVRTNKFTAKRSYNIKLYIYYTALLGITMFFTEHIIGHRSNSFHSSQTPTLNIKSLGINVEKRVDIANVCPGDQVTYTLIVRILGGQPGVQYRNIQITDTQIPEIITKDSPYFDPSSDTNNNGELDFGEEFLFHYTATIEETNVNTAQDHADVYFVIDEQNEFYLGEVTGEPFSVTVFADPDFCPRASVGDFVWFDADNDGLQDTDPNNTIPVEGVILNLWTLDELGNPLDIVTTTTSNVDGVYLFSELDPFLVYAVEVVNETVSPNVNIAVDDTIDSDINPNTLFSGAITLSPGEDRRDIDVALIEDTPCSDCEGGLTSLTLKYNGLSPAEITVYDRNTLYYNGVVAPGESLIVNGTRPNGRFQRNNLSLDVNGIEDTEIHVSCSTPIGVGSIFGSFEVLSGISRVGGVLCEL